MLYIIVHKHLSSFYKLSSSKTLWTV